MTKLTRSQVSNFDVAAGQRTDKSLALSTCRFGTDGMTNIHWTWVTDQSLPSSIDAGHHFIAEVLGRLEAERWTNQDIFGIHLAVEEAVVNAIKHGNKLDLNKRVYVSCKMSPERFWIAIEDEGSGFDPNAVPDCTDDAHLHNPNGRGLLLMRCYMSHVEYNDRGNAVTMEKLRKRS
jgi:serine/threonine-protein kinase RsbW